jgi:hypothetical protein
VIPRIEGAVFNICLTTLLNPKNAPVNQHWQLVAAPWTKVRDLPHFDLFREQAHNFYCALDSAGGICPYVTRYQGMIRIEGVIDEYISVALFEPGQVQMGYGRRGEPIAFRVAKGVQP